MNRKPTTEDDRQSLPPLPPTRLGGHIREFLQIKARAWRPKTARGYANILTRFAWNTGDAWPITASHVMAWLTSTRVNNTSIHSYFAHLRTFFNYLQVLGHIEEAANPVRQITRLKLLPKRPHLAPAALTNDEVSRLLAHLRRLVNAGDLSATRDLALIHFVLITGCRAGEVAALRRQNLSLPDLAATINAGIAKSHQVRTVFFNQGVKADLSTWLGVLDHWRYRGDHIFTQLRGGRPKNHLTPSGVGQLFKRRLRRAGLKPNHIHALRHTSALLAIEAGVSLEKIRDQLGHADITTTALYLRGRDPARARAYGGWEIG